MQLGVDSMQSFPLADKVRKKLGVDLDVETLLDKSIAELAEIVSKSIASGSGSAADDSTISAATDDGEQEESKADNEDEFAPFPLLPMQRIYAVS